MKRSGITICKKPVYTDVFLLKGTHGVPLEIILEYFKTKGIVIDWLDYVASAQKDGHNNNTIKSNILSAVGDVYGCVYRKEIENRLNKFLKW